jgi:hypothetical protein
MAAQNMPKTLEFKFDKDIAIVGADESGKKAFMNALVDKSNRNGQPRV